MCISNVKPETGVASLAEFCSTPEMLPMRYIRYFIGWPVDRRIDVFEIPN